MNSYYQVNRISCSKLKNFEKHPRYYLSDFSKSLKESKALRLGSAVDMLLTAPEEFEKVFHVATGIKPSGLMGQFADNLIALSSFYEEAISDEKLSQAYSNTDFKRDTFEGVKDKLDKITAYLKAYFDSKDKILLEEGESELANKIVNNLLTNDFTAPYFYEDGVELIYQMPVYWEYDEEECKSLLDLVRINHLTKEIYPFDIKTSGGQVKDFITSLIDFRYDLQGSFYTEALNWFVRNDEKYKGYKVMPFSFIVESTSSPGSPQVFTLSDKVISQGKIGWVSKTGIEHKGFSDLIADLKWHKMNNKWDYTKSVYLNQGITNIVELH